MGHLLLLMVLMVLELLSPILVRLLLLDIARGGHGRFGRKANEAAPMRVVATFGCCRRGLGGRGQSSLLLFLLDLEAPVADLSRRHIVLIFLILVVVEIVSLLTLPLLMASTVAPITMVSVVEVISASTPTASVIVPTAATSTMIISILFLMLRLPMG